MLFINKRMSLVISLSDTQDRDVYYTPNSSKWKVISYRPCTLINTLRSETMHEFANSTGNRLNTWTCHLTPPTIPLGVIPLAMRVISGAKILIYLNKVYYIKEL